jgi:FtsH-binding integral membrane protein
VKLGLVVSSMYIIFDTYLIMEEAKRGHKDVIAHSIRLLTDFLKVFMRILVILSKDKKKKSD